jgi:repressor LexA
MPNELSANTQAVFDFIREHFARHGYSPTLREIGEGCFMSHTTVLRHLDRLEGKGWITRQLGTPRSIALSPDAPKSK